MKKGLLTLVCVTVLCISMSMTTSAAGSTSASSVASSSTTTTAQNDAALATATQQFDNTTIAEFAKTTTVSSSVTVTIGAVSLDTAKDAIAQAKKVVGDNAFVATIVDLSVPAGTGAATYTVGCPNGWAGQDVTIIHQKADMSWESIKPTAVANNSVTFNLESNSPIAIVINATTAPKTGDMVMVIAMLAILCLAGVAVFGKRVKLN